VVDQAARALVERLVGDRPPSLVVEEHGAAAEELDIAAVLDACRTPALLGDRRVVVVREAGRIPSGEAAGVAQAIGDLAPSTTLVLVGGGGTVPQPVVRAVAALGGLVEVTVSRARDRSHWLAEQLRSAPVRLDAAARGRLEEHLGEDVGRLAGLLEALAAAYGTGATVSADALEPFLGAAGAVAPWELTDAIDAGSIAGALRALQRMLGPGGRHPTEVIGVLHRHYSAMWRLDGAGVDDAEAAAELLGLKSSFVAKKAIAQGRKLGSARIGQAVVLLAEADLDVKGRTGLPPDLVLEVLVARLARLVRPAVSRR
jgi:DNA polymerase-3 subunit delta